jgi:hypothetical protein
MPVTHRSSIVAALLLCNSCGLLSYEPLLAHASYQTAVLSAFQCVYYKTPYQVQRLLCTRLIVPQMLLGVGKGYSSSGYGRTDSDGYDQYDLNSKQLYVSITLST